MKQDIDVKGLIVNPENYRFDPVDNQGEAIDLMLEEKSEEIVNLAKHIYENGLDGAKDSRVLEVKKNLFLVLDGNRRVTAIKCLQDTALVKDDALRSRFIRILKGQGVVPQEVNCFIYKNEKEAAEWIKLDHTGKNNGVGQDPWEPAGRERFDYKFEGKVSPAMQVISFFQVETKRRVDTKALKMSTVNRILSNPESRSYLGLDIKDGQVKLTAEKKEVVARLDKLFNKIIVDDVSVSLVYHTPDSIKFMRELFVDKPKVSDGGKATLVMKAGTGKGLRSIPRAGSRKFLIPKDCILRIQEAKINNIYYELKNIPINVAPNAVGVLFRVFLETSIDYYAYRYGKVFKKDTKLAGKITIVAADIESRGVADAMQLKNVRSVANKGVSILSIDSFHDYVHSFKAQPAPIDLIIKWDSLQEFFQILWAEINRIKSKRKL